MLEQMSPEIVEMLSTAEPQKIIGVLMDTLMDDATRNRLIAARVMFEALVIQGESEPAFLFVACYLAEAVKMLSEALSQPVDEVISGLGKAATSKAERELLMDQE